MFKQIVIRAAATAVILLSPCTPASAAVLSFTGSLAGFGAAGPDPSCSPLPIHGIASPDTNSGTSSLGAFTYSHDICFNPFGGPFQGTFGINFGSDAFTGTLVGSDTPNSTPGVFDLDWTYTILAGTGRFLNASGTFLGTGTVDSRSFPAPLTLNFVGSIDAPAVPEPDTWAMMLFGFGAIGFAMRRRKQTEPKVHRTA